MHCIHSIVTQKHQWTTAQLSYEKGSKGFGGSTTDSKGERCFSRHNWVTVAMHSDGIYGLSLDKS